MIEYFTRIVVIRVYNREAGMFAMFGRVYAEVRFSFPEGDFSVGVRLNMRRGCGPAFLLGLLLVQIAVGFRPTVAAVGGLLSETAS